MQLDQQIICVQTDFGVQMYTPVTVESKTLHIATALSIRIKTALEK